MTWRQATEDADTVIVNEALSSAEGTETVVGEYIDLLVILTGPCQRENVFFLKPEKGNVSPITYSPVHALQNKFIEEHIMFLHAMSGCDTTSAPYKPGKLKFVKTLTKNPNLADVVGVFKNPEVTPESIAAAGERFLVNVYGYTVNQPSEVHQL
ncbi:hypothetical protein JTB14_034697 [Gonioctena quinquepunctata]|nr:hypothetical protein JTB14_034697 [Gonioctena quinquepunctata]